MGLMDLALAPEDMRVTSERDNAEDKGVRVEVPEVPIAWFVGVIGETKAIATV
jgi:hypothetical protein